MKAIGVDEHIWRPSRISSADRAVTVMVDLTRGPDRRLCARLLDAVQGRSGTGYADWLKEQGVEVTGSVEYAALDPFRGYRNAIRDELPEAVAVLDAFHVVKLAATHSTRSDAVSSRPRSDVVGTRTTRSTGSAAPCSPVLSTSPTGNAHDWTSGSRSATRTARSRSPGTSTSRSARSTPPPAPPPAARPPRRSLSRSAPARSPRSPSSAGRYASGALRSLPTSTPAESPTAVPKPSTASSRRPADSPTASATSPTTGSGSCSPQTAPAPTGVRRPSLDQPNEPTQADLRRAGFTPSQLTRIHDLTRPLSGRPEKEFSPHGVGKLHAESMVDAQRPSRLAPSAG